MNDNRQRLEEIRASLRAQDISYGELAELQNLIPDIEPGDVELLEAAGVPEFPEDSGHPETETLTMPAGRWIDLPPDAQYGWLAALGNAIARAAACDQVTMLENPDGDTVAMIGPPPAVRYIARFTPEAWIRGEAVEVDTEPGQEREWDCSAYATQDTGTSRGLYRLRYLDWLDSTTLGGLDSEGVVDNDDMFKDDPDAPAWVRDWRGPFTIRIRRETGD